MPQIPYAGNAPIHTTCVAPKDYEPVSQDLKELLSSFPHEVGFALLSFVTYGIPGLFGSAVAAMAALHKVCDFLLHGRLVCLPGGSACAIGTVVSFETVGTKKGFSAIDNDFCLNLMLAPHDNLDFYATDDNGEIEKSLNAGDLFNKKYTAVKGIKEQGQLIAEQDKMPEPLEPIPPSRYHPTYTEFPDRMDATFLSKQKLDPNNKMLDEETPVFGHTKGSGGSLSAFWVPVLHCEIEGERTDAVCYALDLPMRLLKLGKLCRWKPLGIPVGRFACALVSLAFLPLVLAALPIAWAAGSDDNRDFRNAGRLAPGEQVLVRGHWVYDAGHQGWNEIHPVTDVQRTSELGLSRDLEKIRQLWCDGLSAAPPQGPLNVARGAPPSGAQSPAVHATSMSPEQQAVYTRQLQPENRWIFHPTIDGCVSQRDAPVR